MREEGKEIWEDSKEYKTKKEKKERGVRMASLVASLAWEKDFLPFFEVMARTNKAQMMNTVKDHGEVAFALGFGCGVDAVKEAILETAKDANIDLSEPKESEEPNIQT